MWSLSNKLFVNFFIAGENNLNLIPNDSLNNGFRQMACTDKVWAITTSGQLAYRLGLNPVNPAGNVWLFGINANFLHVST